MKEITTESWEDFLKKKDDVLEKYKSHELGEHHLKNDILFRGQSDANWKLETTLEREAKQEWSLKSYIQLARSCAVQIESFEKTDLHLPSYIELDLELKRDYGKGFIHNLPFTEWIIFLRHHGFPSPLIDWSTSIYLASYFAFIEINKSDYSSVYAYIEAPDGVKIGSDNDININTLGPYLKTHKRHFLQKSRYTIATQYIDDNDDHLIVGHEDVFKVSNDRQDVLIKFLIPSSERKKVLALLNSDYNINPFSLFHSTDSLVKTIGLERIILDS